MTATIVYTCISYLLNFFSLVLLYSSVGCICLVTDMRGFLCRWSSCVIRKASILNRSSCIQC